MDRGYRDHGAQTTAVYIAGQKPGLTPALRRDLRRRSAIGRMKTDGRLARCALKGTLGDALHAVLFGCGHIFRMILAHLTALWAEILAMLMAIFGTTSASNDSESGLTTVAT